MDLRKAERFTIEAADYYGAVIRGEATEAAYTDLVRKYADVDMLRILGDLRALRKYRYESRGWRRLRARIDRKAERFRKLCESEVKSSGDGFSSEAEIR